MIILAGVCCLFTLLGPAPPSAAALPAPEKLALEREIALLRTELELGRGPDFYLRLDARTRRLTLMLKGVPLREHPLDAFEIGRPRVFFWRRSSPAGWDLHAWVGGELDPRRARDRVEVVAPAPSPNGDAAALEPSPPALPPTAEEAYSVPSRYRIVFAGGFSVEVTASGGGRNRGLLRRATDVLALRVDDLQTALRPSRSGRVRLRLRMSADDAALLYRSLPPEVGLVVVGLASG